MAPADRASAVRERPVNGAAARSRRVLLAPAIVAITACAARAPATAVVTQPQPAARQLVVVITPGWDSTSGTLRRFVRADEDAPWQRADKAVPIVVGRTGLAWGAGFDSYAAPGSPTAGPVKREGDGRSPAGIFPITAAFGFAPADSVRDVRLPYLQLTPGIECVDDTASSHYNAVVDRGSVPLVDWQTSERMREVPVYRLGVIVGYNTRPALRARGSCIFFHIWNGPRSTTVGCTAMAAPELERLVAWLDPRAHPAVVQLSAAAYDTLRAGWQLPALDP